MLRWLARFSRLKVALALLVVTSCTSSCDGGDGDLDGNDGGMIDTGGGDTAPDTTSGCVDEDGDGRGPGCEEPDDCEGDGNNWVSCSTCVDLDDDGFWTGCDRYRTIDGPDCDDDDNAQTFAAFVDADGDLFGTGPAVCVESRWVVHLGMTVLAGDCDDTDPAVNPAMADIPSDGVDNDCTGGDSVLSDQVAVFVDAQNGRADGAGTMADPISSLDHALTVAQTVGPPRLYVAEGDYGALTPTVTVVGGFRNTGGAWEHNPSEFRSRISAVLPSAMPFGRVAVDGFHLVWSPVIEMEQVNECDSFALANNLISPNEIPHEGFGAGFFVTCPTLIVNNVIQNGSGATDAQGIWSSEGLFAAVGNRIEFSGIEARGIGSTATQAVIVANEITFVGSGATLNSSGIEASYAQAVRIQANQITLDGFDNIYAISIHDGKALVSDNTIAISGPRHASGVWTRVDAEVRNNVISLESGVGLIISSGNSTVINNVVEVGSGRAVGIGDADTKMLNNTIATTDGPVVQFNADRGADCLLVNNAIRTQSTDFGSSCLLIFSEWPADSLSLYNNNCDRPDDLPFLTSLHSDDAPSADDLNGCAWTECLQASGNLAVNSGFSGVGPLGFSLRPTSLLIDAGIDPSSVAGGLVVDTDINGDSRPSDGDGDGMSGWDVGADEFVPH